MQLLKWKIHYKDTTVESSCKESELEHRSIEIIQFEVQKQNLKKLIVPPDLWDTIK